jgi:hypothetical protein
LPRAASLSVAARKSAASAYSERMMTVTFEGARAAFRDSLISNCVSWSGGHAPSRNDGVLSASLFQTLVKNGIARLMKVE